MPSSRLREITDFIKLEHTIFDLPFVVSGALLASGPVFLPVKYILILLAATTARATGMSINRLLGRRYDEINPRKKQWSLVKGTMSLRKALAITIFSALVFEASSFFLNRFVFILSPVVLFLFITDPLLKRVTQWRHIYMGSVIGVGVLAGYLSVKPVFPSTPELYVLFAAASLWIAGFDMIYVIPDIPFDRINGLKTVMTEYGTGNGLRISWAVHILTIALFLLMGILLRSVIFEVLMIPIAALIVLEHLIVDPDDPATIRRSFLGANSFIGFIFLIAVILYTLGI
ncbi:prenyltransferase [Thermoplasmatales archaeon]|nr:prenyltransferase [Thermoplasmatales archaeon]